MDATQISQVVDKLAEKIGVSVEQLRPIAEETISQVSMRGWSLFIAFIVGTLFMLLAVIVFCMLFRKTEDDDAAVLLGLGIVFSFVGCIVFFCMAIYNLGHWVAPLPSIMGL